MTAEKRSAVSKLQTQKAQDLVPAECKGLRTRESDVSPGKLKTQEEQLSSSSSKAEKDQCPNQQSRRKSFHLLSLFVLSVSN
jgi:hypothetical protein